ncbi:MAG: ribonuclease III [Candidatus Roizmanbacteria bacterium]
MTHQTQSDEFQKLESTIKITFSNRKLLQNVFVHRSYLNENRDSHLENNEKLEFLGDSVLSLITSIYLYKRFPELKEGDYTDIKASIVRTESLAEVGKQLSLGTYLYLSRGEQIGSGHENTNIIADCFEALVASIFIDKGFDTAYDFVEKHLFSDRLPYIVKNKLYLSPKSRLQEVMQAKYKVLPTYEVTQESGPEHQKFFTIKVCLGKKVLGIGSGQSKKQAEEQAAKIALENGI